MEAKKLKNLCSHAMSTISTLKRQQKDEDKSWAQSSSEMIIYT
jgi:Sec-independent protein translocase protein TatA